MGKTIGFFQSEKSAKLLKSFGNSEAYKACPAAQAKVNIRQLGWFKREMRTGVNRNSLSGHMHGNLARFPVLSQRAASSCLAQDDLTLGVETTTTASGPLFLSSSSPGCCVLLSTPLPHAAASSHFRGQEPSPFRYNKQLNHAPKSPSPPPSKNCDYAHV